MSEQSTDANKELERKYRIAVDKSRILLAIHNLGILAEHAEICGDCFWYTILKPLVHSYVGYGRGYPTDSLPPEIMNGADFLFGNAWKVSELLAATDNRSEATGKWEAWLRTSQAFDIFTDTALDRLTDGPCRYCARRHERWDDA